MLPDPYPLSESNKPRRLTKELICL